VAACFPALRKHSGGAHLTPRLATLSFSVTAESSGTNSRLLFLDQLFFSPAPNLWMGLASTATGGRADLPQETWRLVLPSKRWLKFLPTVLTSWSTPS
jgi:hypothetical protein